MLSILAAEYPVEKLSAYISDDGAAILTFEAMAEACNFAQLWVPFCRKHNIEPRNPDSYFSTKGDPTKNKKRPDFVKERRWIKREYDEFKVRINGLPDVIKKRCEGLNRKEEREQMKMSKDKSGDGKNDGINITKATWMADGTHWPGTWFVPAADHKKGDHAGILQVRPLWLAYYAFFCMRVAMGLTIIVLGCVCLHKIHRKLMPSIGG